MKKVISPFDRQQVSEDYEKLVKSFRPVFGNTSHISLAKRIDAVSREVRLLKGKPQTGVKIHELKEAVIRDINYLNKK